MPTKLYIGYIIMKKSNLTYTLFAIAIITVAVVYFVSSKKPVTTGEQTMNVKVKIAPEKQLVKPDDIVEETIVGSEEQPVIGDQNGRGPVMTVI